MIGAEIGDEIISDVQSTIRFDVAAKSSGEYSHICRKVCAKTQIRGWWEILSHLDFKLVVI